MTMGNFDTKMSCKKCGKTGINDEAFNAPNGGFLCKSCYRVLQTKSLGIGLLLAVVGLVTAMLIIAVAVIWLYFA